MALMVQITGLFLSPASTHDGSRFCLLALRTQGATATKATMLGEYFQLRHLLWDEICPHVRPSEAEELRRAIGNQLIDGNAELKQELGLLVEILAEFQRQSDGIRVRGCAD
jgi:hypothetical protein